MTGVVGILSSTSSNCHIVERSETIVATAPCAEVSIAECRKTSAGILGASTSHFNNLLPHGNRSAKTLEAQSFILPTDSPIPARRHHSLTWAPRNVVVEPRDSRMTWPHRMSSLVLGQIHRNRSKGRLFLALRIHSQVPSLHHGEVRVVAGLLLSVGKEYR